MSRYAHRHWIPGVVSIIVPVLSLSRPRHWRHPLKTPPNCLDLLDDIYDNVSIEFEVIIVCNSSDKTLTKAVATDPRVRRYCFNSENVGVSRSWNMGAMMAEGEYLCFVNDDVEIGPGSIEALVDVFSRHDAVGQAGPKGAVWPRARPGRYVGQSQIEEADAISGFMFMTTRKTFDEVAGFDVSFTPAGCEEIDYSFAVRHAGYKCLVVPGLDVIHHGESGVSSREAKIEFLGRDISTSELAYRNMGLFQKKWGGP